MKTLYLLGLFALLPAFASAQDFHLLFDGQTLNGWEGNLDYFRVEEGSLVAGRTDRDIPNNEFLCTTEEYGDFELRFQVKMNGRRNNGGLQIRTQRIPGHHEVSGYQCDIGEWPPENTKRVWGALYDESRRDKYLVSALENVDTFTSMTDWNDYRILAEGPRIQIWVNDVQTADFTETQHIPRTGLICAQIHFGPPAEVWHRNMEIRKLD